VLSIDHGIAHADADADADGTERRNE